MNGMGVSDNTLIGLAAIIGLAATFLLLGVRVWTGDDYEQLGPIVKIENFWLWLAVVVIASAAGGFAVFLLVTS